MLDGFLAGHLYLPVQPDPRLFQLADLYDPIQNQPYRMHDASVYRGKYYLYFGPSPVLLLLLFRLAANVILPEALAIAMFLFGALILSYRAFQQLIQRFAPATPWWFSVIAIAVLGYSNFTQFLMRRPAVYETAIAGAHFYFWAAVYLLVRALTDGRRRYLQLGLAGICMGLTFGARPNYAAAIVVALGVVAAVSMIQADSKSLGLAVKRLLAISIPLGVVGLLLLTYNYLRFDSIFEFGQKYQLAGLRPGKFFSADYFWYNLKTYMLWPSEIDRHFPFFHLRIKQSLVYTEAYGEPIGGMLATVPVTALAVLVPLAWVFMWKRWWQGTELKQLAVVATVFSACGFAMVLLLSFNGGITERYVVDFVPFFLFSSLLVWVGLDQSLKKVRLWRPALNGFLVFALAFGVFLNAAVGLTGYYDNLRYENPPTYNRIQSWFKLIEKS
jgi:hypothetical protein